MKYLHHISTSSLLALSSKRFASSKNLLFSNSKSHNTQRTAIIPSTFKAYPFKRSAPGLAKQTCFVTALMRPVFSTKNLVFKHFPPHNKQRTTIVPLALNPYNSSIPAKHTLLNETVDINNLPLIPLEDNGILEVKVGLTPTPRAKGEKARLMGATFKVLLPNLSQKLQEGLENANSPSPLPDNKLTIGGYSKRVVGIINNEKTSFMMPALYSKNNAIYARSFAAVGLMEYQNKRNQAPNVWPQIINFSNNQPTVDPLLLTGIAMLGDTNQLFDRTFSNIPGTVTINKTIDDTKLMRGIESLTLNTTTVVPLVSPKKTNVIHQAGEGYSLLKTLPVNLTTIVNPLIRPLPFTANPADLKTGSEVIRVNARTLRPEPISTTRGENMTIYVNYENNLCIPLGFDNIAAFYEFFASTYTWSLFNITTSRPQKGEAAVELAEPSASNQINLSNTLTTNRFNVNNMKFLDWEKLNTPGTAIIGENFTVVNFTVESVDTKFAFGLTSQRNTLSSPFACWQIFADGANFSRVYVHPQFLLACLDEQLLQPVRELHSKSVKYDTFEIKSYSQKTWIEDRADVSGTTLLSGGHTKYYGNLMATGLFEFHSMVNKKDHLIFTPVFNGHRVESAASRYIPLTIIQSARDIEDNHKEIETIRKVFASPLELLKADGDIDTPALILNPCYKRGNFYRLAQDMTFKGLVSGGARSYETDEE